MARRTWRVVGLLVVVAAISFLLGIYVVSRFVG